MRKLLVLVLAGSTAFAASYDTAKAGMDPDRLARIPVRMKAFVDKGTIAGAVVLIQRHGVVASMDAVGYQRGSRGRSEASACRSRAAPFATLRSWFE